MNDLLSLAFPLIVLAATLMIGTAVVAEIYDSVNETVGGDSTLDSIHTSVGNALTSFGGFLPMIILATMGGAAISALIASWFGAFRQKK